MRSIALAACAAVLVCTGGCDAKKEAPPPGKAPAQAVKPGSGPASAPAAPHGEVKPSTPPGANFSGLVKLAEGLTADAVKPTDVLFIMARESQGGGLAGRLVAVKRVGKTAYPMRYELGAADVMVPGIPFQGPFIVTARLDRDGDPMSRGPDDLYAVFLEPVKPGQEGVHLVLKKGAPKTVPAPPGVKAPGSRRSSHPTSQPAGAAPTKGAASQPAAAPAPRPASQPAAKPASQPAR